jgi:hypothetical protein
VYGEASAVVDVEKKGFEGVGGERELRVPTGTREIDIGLPDMPRPCARPWNDSKSNALSEGEGVAVLGTWSANVIEP